MEQIDVRRGALAGVPVFEVIGELDHASISALAEPVMGEV